MTTDQWLAVAKSWWRELSIKRHVETFWGEENVLYFDYGGRLHLWTFLLVLYIVVINLM